MGILFFIFGLSLAFNVIIVIGLIIAYKKFIKDNPLSIFYKTTKKKKDDDIISKLKNKSEMEFWDL